MRLAYAPPVHFRWLTVAATLTFGVAYSARSNAATYQVGPGKTYTSLG
jgi:hypothetical protein